MPAAEGNNLVFTDHSLNLVGINGNYLEPKKFITYESLSSLAQSKMPFFSNLSREGENEPLFNYVNRVSDKNRHFIIKNILGGAALNKIFVLDERIQQFSREIYTYNGYSALHYAMYQAMNIFMPYPKFYKNSDETNRLRQTFEYDLNCEKLGEDLINQINTSLCKIKPKFIVIHYGILERIFGKNKENKIPVILNEWAKKFSDSDIIITSGRTRLEGLPTNVRFLNLAPLLTAFIDVRSKYLIDKILNDSRI
jgi:hypothetical protein